MNRLQRFQVAMNIANQCSLHFDARFTVGKTVGNGCEGDFGVAASTQAFQQCVGGVVASLCRCRSGVVIVPPIQAEDCRRVLPFIDRWTLTSYGDVPVFHLDRKA